MIRVIELNIEGAILKGVLDEDSKMGLLKFEESNEYDLTSEVQEILNSKKYPPEEKDIFTFLLGKEAEIVKEEYLKMKNKIKRFKYSDAESKKTFIKNMNEFLQIA